MNHTEKNFLFSMTTCVLSIFALAYGIVQVGINSDYFWLFPILVVLGNIGVFVFLMRQRPWLATFKKMYTVLTIFFVMLLVISLGMIATSEFLEFAAILGSLSLSLTILLEQFCMNFFLRRREL